MQPLVCACMYCVFMYVQVARILTVQREREIEAGVGRRESRHASQVRAKKTGIALRPQQKNRFQVRVGWCDTHTHRETWMLSHLVCTCNSCEAICCVHPRVRHWSGNINRANAHTIRPCLCLCLLFMCTLRPPDPGEEGTIAEQEGKEEGTEAHARGSSGASRWPGTTVMGFCVCSRQRDTLQKHSETCAHLSVCACMCRKERTTYIQVRRRRTRMSSLFLPPEPRWFIAMQALTLWRDTDDKWVEGAPSPPEWACGHSRALPVRRMLEAPS